jgi:hypothetical protein
MNPAPRVAADATKLEIKESLIGVPEAPSAVLGIRRACAAPDGRESFEEWFISICATIFSYTI